MVTRIIGSIRHQLAVATLVFEGTKEEVDF